jgi:hypothetical protein
MFHDATLTVLVPEDFWAYVSSQPQQQITDGDYTSGSAYYYTSGSAPTTVCMQAEAHKMTLLAFQSSRMFALLDRSARVESAVGLPRHGLG